MEKLFTAYREQQKGKYRRRQVESPPIPQEVAKTSEDHDTDAVGSAQNHPYDCAFRVSDMGWCLVLTSTVMIILLAHYATSLQSVTRTGTRKPTSRTFEWDSWIDAATKGSLQRNALKFKFPRAPHLRVAAESWPPHVEVFSEGGQPTIKGPMSNLLIALSKSLNFTYSIVQGDGYWGAPQANGSWNGMIGLLLTKKADIGLGPFGISPARFEVLDFTVPVLSQNIYALVSRPKPESEVWGFLSPFTWYVWVSLLISSLLIAAVSTASARALEADVPTAFFNHLLISYQIFMGQGVSIMPKSLSLRLTMLLWLVFVFIVTRSYSGSMTSLLAAKTITIKYDSIRDILDDPNMKIVMESATVLTDHLQKAKAGVFKDLSDGMKTRGTFAKAEDMQNLAYKYIPGGRHAVILEASSCDQIYSDSFRRTGQCDFYKAKEPLLGLYYSLVVPKGSPLLRLLSTRVQALQEHGMYNRWTLLETPYVTGCSRLPTKIRETQPYEILELWAVFLVTGCGLVLACIALACERMSTYLRRTDDEPTKSSSPI
ncbi:probable glutamate receptor isoform X2 [Macrobrachium rosenbergii]|uniref:probable glutamate receptor isoform X2 n=1 Tax=Macrobrachium rosenbergii TaxID=79674 RepID=UPI0034D762E3